MSWYNIKMFWNCCKCMVMIMMGSAVYQYQNCFSSFLSWNADHEGHQGRVAADGAIVFLVNLLLMLFSSLVTVILCSLNQWFFSRQFLIFVNDETRSNSLPFTVLAMLHSLFSSTYNFIIYVAIPKINMKKWAMVLVILQCT